MSAHELLAALSQNEDYVAREATRESDRIEAEASFQNSAAPILEALRSIGIRVRHLWELANSGEVFPEAQPILFEHLQKPYPPKVREFIARAMSERSANPFWPELRRLFEVERNILVKDALAVALVGAASASEADQIIQLLRDPEHGTSRVLLVQFIARLPKEQALLLSAQLADDKQIAIEVRRVVKQLSKKQ
jgi:hypothetical protein